MASGSANRIWYGGDWNPDQWPREVWERDIELFKEAHINIVTLPVFSWALLQPEEERYEFGWLDEVLEELDKHGIGVCLATSTAAVPAWMARRHPDVLRVDFQGRQRRFGARHNFCPNSPTYRQYSARLAEQLARRYKDYPGLVAWHVNNEYGGRCYCDRCAREFRVWLQRRYGALDELNRRWNTRFWGHTLYDWEEIVPPNVLSEHLDDHDPTRTAFQPISLDYDRFMSDSLLECFKGERDAIKRWTPDVPVTTNLMGAYKPLDYFKWAREMDVVSWDSYPPMDVDVATVAFRHDLMRGLKDGQPFMLMEQTPSQQNWQPYNSLKRPGVMRLWSYQALAHGAETVMFFQLRQSQGACEKFHGAVISHAGTPDTRVFREVQALGRELEALGDTFLGSRIDAQVALVFDWENWWAIEYSSGPSVALKYLPQVEAYYRALWRANVAVDVVSPGAPLGRYRLVIAPVAYMMHPGFAEKVETFVAGGGTFLSTFFSGIVDENDRIILGGYPGPLRRLLGVWVEETDALPPDMTNRIVVQGYPGLDGQYACSLLFDLLHTEGAEVVGRYGADFYAGRPVLTRHRVGAGEAWYVGSAPEQPFVDRLVRFLCDKHGIGAPLQVPDGVEVVERRGGGQSFLFILNHRDRPTVITLGNRRLRNLLAHQEVEGEVELAPRDVLILTDTHGAGTR
ncbi:MAG: beta-galactosidase [Limnochordaceae bacterium]|nr:beta-galactosidase [Limnochordaceae bacterium]